MSNKMTLQEAFILKTVIAVITALEKQPTIDKAAFISDLLAAMAAWKPQAAEELQHFLAMRAP